MQRVLVSLSLLVERAHAQEPSAEALAASLGCRRGFLWGGAAAARHGSLYGVSAHNAGDEGRNGAWVAGGVLEADVQHAADCGLNSFQFPVVWPRVYSRGQDGLQRANLQGVAVLKGLTAAVLARRLTPLVAMFQWDLPAEVDWRSSSSVEAFAEYADFLFRSFPEVKSWITFDDPLSLCKLRYGADANASGVESAYDQYQCGHNVLRAHARAVAIYRQRYKGRQISIVLRYDFASPLDASDAADQASAQLSRDFGLGWWADPIFLTGDYPESMRRLLGERLPAFSSAERAALRGSWEGFYGLGDGCLRAGGRGAAPGAAGGTTGQTRVHPVQRRVSEHLQYVYARYRPASILITGSGCEVPGAEQGRASRISNDTSGLDYYRSYLAGVATAVSTTAVPVKGFYVGPLPAAVEQSGGALAIDGTTSENSSAQQPSAESLSSWIADFLRHLRANDASPFRCLESGRLSIPPWVTAVLVACPMLICAAVILVMRYERSSRHGAKPTRRAVPVSTDALMAKPEGVRAAAGSTLGGPSHGLSLWSDRVPSFLLQIHAAEQAEATQGEAGDGDAELMDSVQRADEHGPDRQGYSAQLPSASATSTSQDLDSSPSSITVPMCQPLRITPRVSSYTWSRYLFPHWYWRRPAQYRLMVRAPPVSLHCSATVPRVTHVTWRRQPAVVTKEAMQVPPAAGHKA